MATTEQFSLRWNNFHSNLTTGFHDLLEAADMVDVTLAVEGQFLQAHKIVLSICSPYFKQMFKINPCQHPIVILKDITHDNLKDILEFMYLGEVNVMRENLPSFLRTAELLQVKGLTGDDSQSESSSKREEKAALTDDEPEYNQLIESDGVNFTSSPKPSTKRQRSPMYTPTLKKSKSDSKSVKENCNENERHELLPNIKSEMSLECEDKDQMNKLYPEGVFNADANPHENGKSVVLNRNGYKCGKCLKMFSRRDHLRTHEKNIHGEDVGPFACTICSQLYKNSESLRKHIAKFHYVSKDERNLHAHLQAQAT
ncbi:PREDICTED: protein abrupt-like isoform X1 [Nicrophorus vespilloides]|uniref:Protein abrupt-like isoform X1 n=1 Tax=Nicrophorus vespilloides TaxID=110193 RepID=A0ABM1N2R1_NICVS|nr:PREDICTED: protein abrupt-like isoform X1 [Nicrophorus vespilloides]